LPGVGRNLHDHPLIAGLLFRAKQPVPVSHYNHCETLVIASSSHAPGWADLQLMGLSAPFLLPELGTPPPDSFSIVPALMYPRSRGSLTLASADPRTPAIIDPNYLGDDTDVATLVEGIEMARALADTPPLRAWIAEEVLPGPAVRDKAAIAAHVRRSVSPFFHPVSTCRMGHADDDQAVVDPACRVRGLDGLRVVDASIFPSIPQAMTNAATLAVAERAADLLRHRA
jgi:choline dehydrogenase